MKTVISGLVGLLLLLFYDLATIRQLKGRMLLAFGGYGLHAGALFLAARSADKMPGWKNPIAGWLIFAVGSCWLIYCLFGFVPIAGTYTDKGPPALTTEGPYAFSRHPGAIGHALAIAGLFLISPSRLLLSAGIWWISANLLYVYLQDRWLFPRIFPGYNKYRHNTPMILPTRSSLKSFLCFCRRFIKRKAG